MQFDKYTNTGEKPHPFFPLRKGCWEFLGQRPQPQTLTRTPGHVMETPRQDSETRWSSGALGDVWQQPISWELCPHQWCLGPEAPGWVCIFATMGSGGCGTSACSHEHEGAHSSPIPWEPPGEAKQPARHLSLSCHPQPLSSYKEPGGGDRKP